VKSETLGTVLVNVVTSPTHVVGIVPVLVRYSSQFGTGTALPMQLSCCAAVGSPV
jgi:hypothetical protein